MKKFDDIEIGEPISYKKRSFKFDNVTFFDDEGCKTKTSIDQCKCESSCAMMLYAIETSVKNMKKGEDNKEEEVVDMQKLNISDLFHKIQKKRYVLVQPKKNVGYVF